MTDLTSLLSAAGATAAILLPIVVGLVSTIRAAFGIDGARPTAIVAAACSIVCSLAAYLLTDRTHWYLGCVVAVVLWTTAFGGSTYLDARLTKIGTGK